MEVSVNQEEKLTPFLCVQSWKHHPCSFSTTDVFFSFLKITWGFPVFWGGGCLVVGGGFLVIWGCAVCFQSWVSKLPQDFLLHSKGTCFLSACNLTPYFRGYISFCADPTYIVKDEQCLMPVDLTNYPQILSSVLNIFSPEDTVVYLTICMPVQWASANLCLIFLSHESFQEVHLLKEIHIWSISAAFSPAEKAEGNQRWDIWAFFPKESNERSKKKKSL